MITKPTIGAGVIPSMEAAPVSHAAHGAIAARPTHFGIYRGCPRADEVLYTFMTGTKDSLAATRFDEAYGLPMTRIGVVTIPQRYESDVRKFVSLVPEANGRLGFITYRIEKNAKTCLAFTAAYFPKRDMPHDQLNAKALGAFLDMACSRDLLASYHVTHMSAGAATPSRLRQLEKAGLSDGPFPILTYIRAIGRFVHSGGQ